MKKIIFSITAVALTVVLASAGIAQNKPQKSEQKRPRVDIVVNIERELTEEGRHLFDQTDADWVRVRHDTVFWHLRESGMKKVESNPGKYLKPKK
ncbi:MAG: hypothetical protein NC336_07325 [Clostridium sp.]|nr:hypothetical protein [Clostridium sp.]